MGDKPIGERLAVLEAEVEHLAEKVREIVTARASRAAREWAVILTGISLVGAILAKNLGFM